MSKIIIVDDDPTNISLTQMLLELEGFSVTTAADIKTAVELADPHTDAFIVDYHLARGASGIELIHKIRNGDTNSASNSIIIVTSGDYRREQEVLDAGANLFMFKPYQPQELIQHLHDLIHQQVNHG